ncbi:MAG TPA: LLM class flavin-dependent oxidoreductase [Acidimicrobiales bacterium]|jgi:alkanesulfonate monooxygenase SsuD/methylene tetrahydromethanopterin reductase-like flavin-dependent oxidoreductase (luciferase family)|nr:LLM class flavin-dependent oxidoreductase [Acidimicrobiales bacterium]
MAMKFAMFYEIPVARPWDPRSEYRAYKDTVEQVKLGDKVGFHSFWTVEHHFLEEYSHCSNPETLYGHIAAVTENIRIGYGVRLLPKPYNHPVRTAESVAVLDLLSDGRVEFGTGRSSTRAELEGFGINPKETREMWREALQHIVGCWTNDEYEFKGDYWSMPKRRVLPKPFQQPHPPIWGATSSLEGHYEIGKQGIGLCSFTVGQPPEMLAERIENFHRGHADCPEPVGLFRNQQAATFTMVHCNTSNERARAVAEESFVWYPKHGGQLIASVADMMEGQELGNYAYAGETRKRRDEGALGNVSMDYIWDSGAGVVGDPDRCIEIAKRYEAIGCDVLFCLFNPYNIPHEETMTCIELMGRHVLPEFAS